MQSVLILLITYNLLQFAPAFVVSCFMCLGSKYFPFAIFTDMLAENNKIFLTFTVANITFFHIITSNELFTTVTILFKIALF